MNAPHPRCDRCVILDYTLLYRLYVPPVEPNSSWRGPRRIPDFRRHENARGKCPEPSLQGDSRRNTLLLSEKKALPETLPLVTKLESPAPTPKPLAQEGSRGFSRESRVPRAKKKPGPLPHSGEWRENRVRTCGRDSPTARTHCTLLAYPRCSWTAPRNRPEADRRRRRSPGTARPEGPRPGSGT